MQFLRQNTAVIVYVGPFLDKTDGVTLETALTITNERITLQAATDAGSAPTIILDNVTGATSGTSNDLNYIAGQDNGMMQLELAAADVNRVGRVILTITDAANHCPVFHEYFILPTAVYDWLTGVTANLSVNAVQIGSQTASASGTVTFPSTVASTTNITAASGVALSSAGVQAIWDALTSALTTVGSIGKKLVDSVTQTGDSYARLGAPSGASVSADIAAVKSVADSILVDTGTDLPAQIGGIGNSGGAAINTDPATDNSAGGISGVTSGTTKVGTETGTYTNASNVNSVYHQITHSGNAIDWVYQFLTGGGTSPVGMTWVGYLDGSNDTITFYAWNHVGAAWESIGTQAGQAGTVNVTKNLILYARHRGTSAAELGKVYIRLACSAQTAPILYTDQLYVSYSVTSRSVGYANGAVWVDTISGIAGTESFVNGVADNPVLSLADALTIATNNLLRNFNIANGSSITLASTTSNKVFDGHEWNLALGGQSIASSMFIDANVSGTGTGSEAEFETCTIGAATLPPCYMWDCSYTSTVTCGAAGDYFIIDGASGVAGGSAPVFDLASAGANNLAFRRWSGGITFNNISSNDVISVDVVSGGTITLNGADGSVFVRGMCNVVDNRTGSPTLNTNNNTDARFDTLDANTAAIYARLGAPTGASIAADIAGVQVAADGAATPSEVNAEIVDALATDVYAESSGAVGATSTIAAAIVWLKTLGRNKVTQTSTTQVLRNDADSGNIATSTVSDDGTTFTRGEWN